MSNATDSIDASRQPIVFIREGEAFANSRDVAEYFGKQHFAVLRDIRNLIEKEESLGLSNFVSFKTNDLTGETTSHYDMDRDGFALLAMGFTGAKALKFKIAYIQQFNAMEAELRGRAASSGVAVQQTDVDRLAASLMRLEEKLPKHLESNRFGVTGYIRKHLFPLFNLIESKHAALIGADRHVYREMQKVRRELTALRALAEPKLFNQAIVPAEWFSCADIYGRLYGASDIPRRGLLSSRVHKELDGLCKRTGRQHMMLQIELSGRGHDCWHRDVTVPWFESYGRALIQRHIDRYTSRQNVLPFPKNGDQEGSK